MRKPASYVRLKLSQIRNAGWAVGGSFRSTSSRHTEFIQLGYNVVREAWHDQNHLHTDSEEWYIVLKGKLDVEVNGKIVSVGPKEILGVKRNVPHRVIGGRGPIEEFSLKVPSVKDKRLVK